MRFGVLCVPYALSYANGEESAQDVISWDLQIAQWADQAGLDELFFAEHYTLGHEPSPAPELMIAAAAQRTTRIKLGALGHLLPYHNPVSLAHRMMWLDHMTGGRYLAGVAPGAFPSDRLLFGTGSKNAEMLAESLDIIESILTKTGPWTIEGKYWAAEMPEFSDHIHGPHLKPLQGPKPEFLMTGMQHGSPTLQEAGRRGFSPVSQEVCTESLRSHWETYSAAAEGARHIPNRASWRIVRDYWVAETDEQARDEVIAGPMGATWSTHNIPTFAGLGLLPLLGGSDVAPEDVTLEWLVDNFFLVGSPETVSRKISELYDATGGFGCLLMAAHGRGEAPEAYQRSWELLMREVAPQVAHLDGSDALSSVAR